jgi:hypothetical protein
LDVNIRRWRKKSVGIFHEWGWIAINSSFRHHNLVNHPPVEYHYVIYDQNTYVVETCSNSTLSDLVFHQTVSRIQFSVDGTTGTTGFCNITIPADLMSGTFSIYKDDLLLFENLNYTQISNGTHYHFGLTYAHGIHMIQIFSSIVIPELSSLLFLSSLTIATVAMIIIGKKLPKKKKS